MLSLGANRLVNRASSLGASVSVPRAGQSGILRVRTVVPIAAAVAPGAQTTPAKKTRKAKADGDVKPKGPLSAWVLFVQEGLTELKASLKEGEKFKAAAEMKELGVEWKQMTEAEKKPYFDLAQKLKGPAEAARAAYKAKQPQVEKKPLTSYSKFVKENYDAVKAKHPNLGFKELQPILSTMWKAVPAEEKAARTAAYKKETDAYNRKHHPEKYGPDGKAIKPASSKAAAKAEPEAAAPAPKAAPAAKPAAAAKKSAAPKAAASKPSTGKAAPKKA